MSVRVILVDDDRQGNRLHSALLEAGFDVTAVIHEADDLFAAVTETGPDAIIIGSDSPKRDTLEHLAGVSAKFPKPMLMLAEHADAFAVRAAARAGVSLYITDTLSPTTIGSLVDVTMAHFESNRELATQLAEARTALRERDLIDKAKRLLMRVENFDEQQAYSYLRRAAMDRGWRIAKLAEQVLIKSRVV